MSDGPRKRKRSGSPSSPSQEHSGKRRRNDSPVTATENAPLSIRKADYSIGWICALPVEMAAASAMLDEKHVPLEDQDPEDANSYRLGRIGKHNVVIACLPEYGTTPATTVAKDMLRTFTSVRVGLLVGIGAGVPSDQDDIRLGDVVVSSSDQTYGGVVQYERGKVTKAGFERLGTLNKPPIVLQTALADLRAQHLEDGHQISATIQIALEKKPRLREHNFQHQGVENDILYYPECLEHPKSDKSCKMCKRAEVPLDRIPRSNLSPKLHYGTIASGNRVIKDGNEREKLKNQFGAKCIEMEAAGLMESFPCLVIRGICDYADSRKNKIWQPYAALTAAAYAKELLSIVQSQRLKQTPTLLLSWHQVEIDALHSITKEIEEGVKLTIAHISKQEARYQDEKHKKCHQALKTSAYRQLKNINPPRVQNTCQWALEHPLYGQWHKCSSDSLLWISADPGCGKSVLSKSLVDEKLLINYDCINICYFFFKDNEEQNSLAIALCAVLHQLFDKQPHLLQHAMAAWDSEKGAIRQEVDQLWDILLAATSDADAKNTVCILDALDECRDSDRRRLVTQLSKFHLRTATAQNSRPWLKFVVTSRPYDDIEQSFQEIPTSLPVIRLRGEEENDQLRTEIDRVIEFRVRKLAIDLSLRPSTEALLRKNLLSLENRTYLWLHLAIEDIRTTYQNSLRPDQVDQEAIYSVPSSVEDAYEKILARVTANQQHNVKIILQIIIGARRPLAVGEMALALGIATSQDRRTLKDVEIDKGHLERQLRNWCGLFVFINHERIYLIHQTAREFLLHRHGIQTIHTLSHGHQPWKHCITRDEVEGMLATICIHFLHLEDWKDTSKYHEDADNGTMNDIRRGFFQYCCKWWASHLKDAGKTSEDVLFVEALSLCNMSDRIFNFYFSKFYWKEGMIRDYPASKVHFAASSGHDGILEHFLSMHNHDIDEKDKWGRTALYLAAQSGDTATAQILLRHSSDVNAKVTDGRHPLGAASYHGHLHTVQVLIDNGADVNAPGGTHDNALLAATYNGHEKVVQILLDNGADVNAKGLSHENALSAAYYSRHKGIVRLLEARFTDDNAHGGLFVRARHLAFIKSHLGADQMLLNQGADVTYDEDLTDDKDSTDDEDPTDDETPRMMKTPWMT